MKRGLTAIVAPGSLIDSGRKPHRSTDLQETANMTAKTTLILGGTGKTGRRIAEQLAARKVPVRIGSRAATPSFDWENRGTWPAALANVDAVYISYYPDLAVPGATDAIRAFTDLAVRSGVRRLVLLSGRGEPEAQRCEEIVKNAGAQWTVLRCSWFNQNFSENYLLEPILAGEVALPAPNVGEPFVDADDIADAAVAALTDAKHAGQLYELTGPRLLTFAEAIEEVAKAAGREIRYVQVSMDDYVVALEQAQLPPEFVGLIKYLFTEVLDGRNAYLTDGVQRALDRAPRDFAEYARRAAASGAWKG
jgi:uncharacterized protein YbjT (DUF2867 family)